MTVKGRSSRMLALSLAVAGLMVGACSSNQAAHSTSSTFKASQVVDRDRDDYMRQLSDLPLRFETSQFHMDLGKNRPGVAVRSTHLVRDQRNPKLDLIFIVFDDLTLTAINARDFSVKWTSRLERRTEYAPVMTEFSVFFVDSKGSYQRFDRASGNLAEVSNVGSGFFPSAPVSANDTHLIVATTNQNGVQGKPDSGNSTIRAVRWQYPSAATGLDSDFEMVQSQPIADLESVYFVSNNGKLYGITAQTGARRFSVDLENIGQVRTTPVLQGDVIYVGSDTQFFAVSRSGDVLWTYSPNRGEVITGPIYAMDDRVVFNTSKLTSEISGGGRYANLNLGRTTEAAPKSLVTIEPSRMVSVSFSQAETPILDSSGVFERNKPYPTKTDEDGNPIQGRSVIHGPKADDWSMPNQGQRVMLKTGNQLFVMYEESEYPYNVDERALLIRTGKVVNEDELRHVTKRIIQVVDPKTGKPIADGRSTGAFDITGIDFVMGSIDPTDRAMYFITKDGHVFKGFALK